MKKTSVKFKIIRQVISIIFMVIVLLIIQHRTNVSPISEPEIDNYTGVVILSVSSCLDD